MKDKKKYAYELEFRVRDYECDMEGIVNNANYQHYMEHTRHEFLLEAGISFAQMYADGITPVVARIQIAYKSPLRSLDRFTSALNVRREGVKYVFLQDIYRLPGRELVTRAKVEVVCLVDGRIDACPSLGEKLKPYLRED